MLEDLIVIPEDSTPLHQQLEHQLMRFIHAGRLLPGQELPSVRAIAAQIAVNPMTVSKTINRLVDKGWLSHRRGRPTCVADPLPNDAEQVDEQLKTEVTRVITHAKQLGISQNELNELLQTLWQEKP